MLVGKLFSVGNTVAVAVPAAYRRRLNWRRGNHVAIAVVGGVDGAPVELRVWSVERVIENAGSEGEQIALRGPRVPAH